MENWFSQIISTFRKLWQNYWKLKKLWHSFGPHAVACGSGALAPRTCSTSEDRRPHLWPTCPTSWRLPCPSMASRCRSPSPSASTTRRPPYVATLPPPNYGQVSKTEAKVGKATKIIQKFGKVSKMLANCCQISKIVAIFGKVSKLISNSSKVWKNYGKFWQISKTIVNFSKVLKIIINCCKVSKTKANFSKTSNILVNSGKVSKLVANFVQVSKTMAYFSKVSNIMVNLGKVSKTIINLGKCSKIMNNVCKVLKMMVNFNKVSKIMINFRKVSEIITKNRVGCGNTVSNTNKCGKWGPRHPSAANRQRTFRPPDSAGKEIKKVAPKNQTSTPWLRRCESECTNVAPKAPASFVGAAEGRRSFLHLPGQGVEVGGFLDVFLLFFEHYQPSGVEAGGPFDYLPRLGVEVWCFSIFFLYLKLDFRIRLYFFSPPRRGWWTRVSGCNFLASKI